MLALLVQVPVTPAAAGAFDRLGRWPASSGDRDLGRDPYWHQLLHFSGGRSLVDPESSFFLAPDGANDPTAELRATLEAMAGGDSKVLCRYPARIAWLSDQLGIDAKPPACPDLDAWRRAHSAERAVIVFADAFPSAPPSMFGHTLLRLDRAGSPALLGKAVGFVADIGEARGFALIARGLAGAFEGGFRVEPYYQAVRRYNHWEDRDLWEYELTLDADEVGQILNHLWELRGVSFRYEFFGDNCSFGILRLIEIARPGTDLTRRFPLWTIPADTVRALYPAGHVGRGVRRPSLASRIREAEAKLMTEERERARLIGLGRAPPADAEAASPAVRELASLIRRYFQWREGAPPERIATADSLPTTRRTAVRDLRGPLWGHASNRASVSGGVRNEDPYVELEYRPALHDLLDPPSGYRTGMQIQIFQTSLRYFPTTRNLSLGRLTALEILSVEPATTTLRPWAWRLRMALESRMPRDSGRSDGVGDGLVGEIDVAAGQAWAPTKSIHGYLLARLSAEGSARLSPEYSLGPGVEIGVLLAPERSRWRSQLRYAFQGLVVGDDRFRQQAEWSQRLSLGSAWAARLTLAWNRDFGADWIEARAGLSFYF